MFNLASKLSETEANFASKFSDDLFNFDSKFGASFCVICLRGCHKCGKHAMQMINRNWAFLSTTSYITIIGQFYSFLIPLSTFLTFCSSSMSETVCCLATSNVTDATFPFRAVDALLLRRHLSILNIKFSQTVACQCWLTLGLWCVS